MARQRNRLRSKQVMGAGNFTPAVERDFVPLPGRATNQIERNKTYNLLLAYYNNTAFEKLSDWAEYIRLHSLYRFTRPIFNPVSRVVDFYTENIYPGVVVNELGLPPGMKTAIPLHPGTPDEIRIALDQIWKWSRWQIGQSLMVHYGALTGNCLVEAVDDLEAGKIRYRVVWPGYVKTVVLDDYGHLQAYVLEYEVGEEDGTRYVFTKEVTKNSIVRFRDDKPVSIEENPYPFIPAVWVKHLDKGNDFGTPAIRTTTKIDELNSVVSHTSDHIHKQIKSPRIMWSHGNIRSLFREDDQLDDGDFDERQDTPMLKGPAGGNTETLVGNLDPQTIVPIIDKFLTELENDYPEIVLYQKLREQNIVTGPAAQQLVGDVLKKVALPAANYDLASQELFTIGLAMAGWRANSGAWGTDLTGHQQKFLPFDLESYERDELEVTMLPRNLIRESSRDEAEELQIRAQAVASVKDVLPAAAQLKALGYRDEEIPGLIAEKQREVQEELDRQQASFEAQAATSAKYAPKSPIGGSSKK